MFEDELNRLQSEAYDHLWNGRFRLALNNAEKVYEARPDDSEAAICLAWALLENGNPTKAMDYANLAVELKGDSIKARVYRAYLLYRMSIFEGAIADIDLSVKKQKEMLAWAYLNKAKALAGLERFEEADQILDVGKIIDNGKNQTYDEMKVWLIRAYDFCRNKIPLTSKNIDLYTEYANQALKTKEYWFSLIISRKILEKTKSDEAELIELEAMLFLFQLKPALKKAESISGKFKKNERFNSVFNALKKFAHLEEQYQNNAQSQPEAHADRSAPEDNRGTIESSLKLRTDPVFFPNKDAGIMSLKLFDVNEEASTGKRRFYKIFSDNIQKIGAEIIFSNPFFNSEEKIFQGTTVWYLNDYEIGRNNFQLNIKKDWDTVIFVKTWGSENIKIGNIGQGKIEFYLHNFKIAERYFGINSTPVWETDEIPSVPQSNDGKKIPDEKTKVQEPRRTVKSLNELLDDLNSFIGLDNIKESVKNFVSYLEFLKERKRLGLKADDKIAINSIFLGNPGTGKTTIARLLGDIFYAMGILPKGHLVEVDRSALVGQYIGETAQKTEKLINEAIGGILFIDEAYTLVKKGGSQDFGQEAIDILLKRMEDRKGEFVVIVAGYPEEMNLFLNSNPGLKSRFNHTFVFEDYTPDELYLIFKKLLQKEEYKITSGAQEILTKELIALYRGRDNSFGNARLVTRLFEESKLNLSKLCLPTSDDEKKKELMTIFNEDVISALFSKNPGKKFRPLINEDALKESLSELDGLVGLPSLKKEVKDMVKLARYFNEQGDDIGKVFSEHLLFLGNPGTGKTTVARIFSKIYAALGILTKGHLVETDRQGLVAGYVGQTAEKTTSLIDKSQGGMLFLDEAYSLINTNENDFGKEAIDILLKRMEDDRGKFIVIAAGYTDEMQRFISSNPGIQSRFSKSFFFEDYSPAELMEIVKRALKHDKKTISKEAEERLEKYFEELFKNRDKKFGNARIVRNILDSVKQKMLLRLSEIPNEERSEDKSSRVELSDITEVLTREIEAKQFEVKGDPLKLQEYINELNNMIGIDSVKQDLFKLISFSKLSQLKKEKGLHSITRNFNSIFIGNAGTGKSTISKLLAKIFFELGILSKGHVVEIERSDIFGTYQGQTSTNLDKVIQQALGGILHIKNANSVFLEQNPASYEALNLIVKRLRDYKDKVIIVLSGEKDEMQKVLNDLPPIANNFPNVFHFEDYSPRELLAIAVNLSERNGYILDEGALQELLDLFIKYQSQGKKEYQNGLLARNHLYAAITNQEERIFSIYEQTDVDLTTINLEDVQKIKL